MTIEEKIFDGVKVAIKRERGDASIRAVIGDGPFTLVVWSYRTNRYGPERVERIDRPPGGHNGWSIDDTKAWVQTLTIGIHVMKYIHEVGLKYDLSVARRKGSKS